MVIEQVSLQELSEKKLEIGYVGEKNHTRVIINCPFMFYHYPDAVGTMIAMPPVGDLYPVILERDGTDLIWDVSESDLAYAGSGQFQLTFTDGSGDDAEVIKTVYGSYSVNQSLEATGEAPDPIEHWMEEAEVKLAEVDGVLAITATASGLPAGSDPTAEMTTVDGHKNIALGIPAGASGELVVETVTGSTPSITGVSNHRYICGTVSTLSITPPESGIIDVVFTSGTTPTVLTVPNTVTFPAWFNPASLQASVTYEISIADGMGVVAVWA